MIMANNAVNVALLGSTGLVVSYTLNPLIYLELQSEVI